MPKDNEVDEKAVAFTMTDHQDYGSMTILTTDRKYAECWAAEGIQVEPLYSAATVAELRGEVERLRADRDNLRALADEAVYVGCMIGLDCASALADLQERGQYVPQCNDGKPSRANARRDAEKITEVYRRGVTLLRGMSPLTGAPA